VSIEIRQARQEDVEEIVDIWQQGLAVAMGYPPPPGDYVRAFGQRLAEQDEVFQFFVAVDGHDVVGWVSLTPFRANPLVRDYMAELSAYVRTARVRGGVARQLLDHTFAHARRTKLQYIMAFISSANRVALITAAQQGFKQVGTLPPSPKGTPQPPLTYLTYVVQPEGA
jgi:L-amino acid N-acyltransferase YncA